MYDELWYQKREAHNWFDKLWNNQRERSELYLKLSKELEIEREQCHFSQMNKEQLEKAITIIKQWWFDKFDK